MTRRRLHLGDPCHSAGEIDEGFEGRDGLLAAERDAAEPFDAVEEALDQMAFLVERPIQRPASGAAAVALDLGCGVQVIGDEPAQRLGVVSGVGDDMADARPVSDQPLGLRAVGPMARRDREPDRQAERVHSRMDLGRQTAAGAADGVSFRPPFCEVASAWTLEMVASISTYSKSGSALNSLKRRPHTPARDQRRNRV